MDGACKNGRNDGLEVFILWLSKMFRHHGQAQSKVGLRRVLLIEEHVADLHRAISKPAPIKKMSIDSVCLGTASRYLS